MMLSLAVVMFFCGLIMVGTGADAAAAEKIIHWRFEEIPDGVSERIRN